MEEIPLQKKALNFPKILPFIEVFSFGVNEAELIFVDEWIEKNGKSKIIPSS